MKKVLRTLSKKTMSLLMMSAMLVNYILPPNVVVAAAPQSGDYGIISINGATSVEDVSNANSVAVTYENGSVTISGSGLYSSGNNVYATGNVTVDCTPNQNHTCELWNNGTNTHGSTININDIQPNAVSNIDATFNSNAQQQQPQQGGNTTSSVTVSAGAGTYNISRPNQQTGESEVVPVNYDDQIDFRINGSMWDHANPGTISYDSNNNETTVVFTFETLWINRYYDNIVINGTPYSVSNYIDFDDRTSWLTHNNGSQLVSFSITNVPKADSYNIVVKHGENNGTRFLSTFLWTADPAQAAGHNYIGNAKLELVKAKYYVGEDTFTVTENDIKDNLTRDGDHLVYRSADGFMSYGVMADVNFDDGNLTLPGEAEVTMRVVPKYGYQVTSVNGGGNFVTTDEGVSEFTVVVHHGEAGYFQATVEPVDNEVIASSKKVEGGVVTLSNDEIDAGTVQLSVDDVELSSDKIKDFKEAAGEYQISNYLDINLNQVLYRGTADEVWSNQIHHLNNEATISLKLEEGIDVNDIVIVHNIDNGDEFEVIKIESYDPKTRIITFKTKSFSNYAIATKTIKTAKNPKTGDNATLYIVMFGLSILSFIGLGVYNKKKRLN